MTTKVAILVDGKQVDLVDADVFVGDVEFVVREALRGVSLDPYGKDLIVRKVSRGLALLHGIEP